MILNIFLIVVLGWLLFELIEHAVLPLVWFLLKKNRRPKTGASGMIGEVGDIKEWNGTEGRIFVHGELWKAESETLMSAGDKAVVKDVQGLTLIVEPQKKS